MAAKPGSRGKPAFGSARATLAEAVACHNRGDLQGAERGYRKVLARAPDHFDALQLLGALRAQAGNAEEAVELIKRAIELNPGVAETYNNLGYALGTLGRSAEALDCYRRAVALKPGYLEAQRNLGSALAGLHRNEEAIEHFQSVLKARPGAEAYCNLGNALRGAGRAREAADCYRKAIAAYPRDAGVHSGLGRALMAQKRADEAIKSYEAALALDPDHSEARRGLGDALYDAGRFHDAIDCFRKALARRPEAEAHFGVGNALLALKQIGAAIEAYDKAIGLKPGYLEAHNNRGNALLSLGRREEALAAYRRALEVKPDFAPAHNHVGNALIALRRYAEAMVAYQAALAADPSFRYCAGMVANCAAQVCDWRQSERLTRELVEGVRAGKPVVTPLNFLAIADSPADQRACAAVYARDQYPATAPLWGGERYRHDRIRVAYLSADFRDHPVAWLIAELIERHDRAAFEVHGISFGPDSPGPMRKRLEAAFDHFTDVRAKRDNEVASALREAEIDIVVDLMGYTQHSRPAIMARRPAPVQVNYLGCPATMGVDFIDYILADRFVIPESQQAHYSEKVVYLPDTFQSNDTQRKIAERAPTRAEVGLPERGFVFCCFNNNYKITPEFFGAWMRVLKRVEGSVLWLLARDAVTAENLRREAQARGMAPERLVFAPRVRQELYLARYRAADLFLDTLPFNAGTTASDALWAGLPVLTCAGNAFAGRMAGSLLNAIGLPELITHTLPDYEALAVKLASEPQLLRGIKERLSANRLTAPLFDIERFRRHAEAAYRTMWETTQRGEPPRSFSVEPGSSGSSLPSTPPTR